MNGKEEIQAYLAIKEDERDYTEGFNLFCKYSRNQAVQNYLARKTDREKLFYKLRQLLEQSDVVASRVPKTSPILRATNQVVEVVEENRLKAVSKGRINPEDLPEELKPLYDEVSENYKKMRSMHEKMKLAKKDKDRAALRKEIVNLDDSIKAGWEVLDAWVLTGELPAEPEKKEVDPKTVNAARKYLSTNLPKLDTLEGEAKEELRLKILDRYSLLVQAGNNFDEATLSILEKHAIKESGKVSD